MGGSRVDVRCILLRFWRLRACILTGASKFQSCSPLHAEYATNVLYFEL